MRGSLVVWRRELAGILLSPLAWVLLAGTFLVDGFLLLHLLESETGGEVNAALERVAGLGGGLFWLLLLVTAPLVTMRMVGEEAHSGLLEYLLTAPVGDGAVIVGKWLAATSFLALLALRLPLFALALLLAGASPDLGQVAAETLGVVFVSGLFAAIGLVTSAAATAPVAAAFLGFLVNAALVLAPQIVAGSRGAWRDVALPVVRRIDVAAHYQGSFMSGAIDTSHLVFFVVWTAACLFLAARLVESRRWR